jgi:hypothetical protein
MLNSCYQFNFQRSRHASPRPEKSSSMNRISGSGFERPAAVPTQTATASGNASASPLTSHSTLSMKENELTLRMFRLRSETLNNIRSVKHSNHHHYQHHLRSSSRFHNHPTTTTTDFSTNTVHFSLYAAALFKLYPSKL